MKGTSMTVREDGGVTIVEFAAETELDAVGVEQIRAELTALVEGGAGRKVVLDFGNVAYVSSQALGTLVTLRLKAARSETRVVLAGIRESLTEIVSLTQIDKLYEVFPNREGAQEALQAT